MKIARLSLPQGPRFATFDEETGTYHVLAGDPMYSGFEYSGQVLHPRDVKLVAPMIPRSKVVGFGGIIDEGVNSVDQLFTFIKPNTAVTGPGASIVTPPSSTDVRVEAELAVVISRMAKDVPVERAHEVVFGYTVANDVTDVHGQSIGRHIAQTKGFDTSCPLGPMINTEVDPEGARVRLMIDGDVVTDHALGESHFSPLELVAYASSMFTLLPGDVIICGAFEPGVQVQPGQEASCEITGIGVLDNPVLAG
ncbi:MAG: fumarylacetoacetate hydrolase family protein [Actinomycetaceae bacterium]|nr:fumarylacetoacetate hydrolase family protein [Arcanobacterium sp.]MDD7504791.1 fumarylacetoacetate hydrolase family protein [Actinomycetaceae bacterium]MDY6142680.1 fumarylacetoacetate hydrolase family protein [Arcanobacterium sp.]